MMPYIVGKDPETDEIIVGDLRTKNFFLRGQSMDEKAIRDLIQSANEKIHFGLTRVNQTIGYQTSQD